MDELEQHIVQSLTSDAATAHASDDEDSSDDEKEEMDIIELTPPKPSLPTRTESIPVTLLLPPFPPPPSPEVQDDEDDEEEEEEAEDEDEDEDMVGAYCPTQCGPAFATGRHHGYSRSALHNLKEFWSCRHDEWIKINTYSSSRAYDGIVTSPRPSLRLDTTFFSSNTATPRISPSSADSEGSQTSTSRTPSPSLDPNSPIFPRVGDLSRLRDPRPAMIDRAFCHVPLYSISKMVFAHELTRAKAPSSEDGTHDVTAMSIYSDDGTLVDEETFGEKKGAGRTSSVDWYERWKVIAEKLGGKPDDKGAYLDGPFSASLSSEGLSWADEVHRVRSRPQSPARKFFFALDDDDFSDREFDDDEDDYGIELSTGRSSFGAGAGCDWGRGYVSDFEMLF